MKDLSRLLSFLVRVLLVAVVIEFGAIYLFMERGEAALPGMKLERDLDGSATLLSIPDPNAADPMETLDLLEEMTRTDGQLEEEGEKEVASSETLRRASSQSGELMNEAEPGRAQDRPAIGNDTVRQSVVYHKVRKGETITAIAGAYELDVDTVMAANGMQKANELKAGTVLKILPRKGFTYTVRRGDTLWNIARTFDTDWRLIREHNNLDDDGLKVGDHLVIPWTQATARRRQELGQGIANRFSWPLKSRITSPFGWRKHPIYKKRIFHAGIDFRASVGTPVKAAQAGRIEFAGYVHGYGRLIIVQHQGEFKDYSTRYAHLSTVGVKPGDWVSAGQIIGKSGSTGRVTGPHLHFEIRKKGRALDPRQYLSRELFAEAGPSSGRI